MPGQKTLLSFFPKTPSAKRVLEQSATNTFNNDNQMDNTTVTKKQKLSDDKVESEFKNAEYNNMYDMKINMRSSWFRMLESEFSKPYFEKLAEYVNGERKKSIVYPKEEHVFSWSTYCDLNDVKVVILGQDPYHGPNQAHGLCFSVREGIDTPPSLKNIYKELNTDIDNFEIPKHGTLIGWATQGVLLLNACLTVRKGEANSHKDKGWETFTDAVVKMVNENLDNVVFLLWGAYAQKRGAMIDKKRHLVLNCVHPSPLSASRGWFGCKHFSKTNEYLKEHSKVPIDWSYLPKEDDFNEKKCK